MFEAMDADPRPGPARYESARTRRRKAGWLGGLERLIRYRFEIPLKRSTRPPEHVARGVMVGTVWATTPLFGLHMLGVFLTWLAARRLARWDFSLVNGLAWTWTTNAFTVIPSYYVFYLTGQIMLGRFGDLGGRGSFDALTRQLRESDAGLWEAAKLWFEGLLSHIGAPLAVGWIPWAIVLGWLAYRLSYGFVVRYRERRARLRREQ